jgi:hypothetical protein
VLLLRSREEDDPGILAALAVDPEDVAGRELADERHERRRAIPGGLALGGMPFHARDEVRGAHAARRLEEDACAGAPRELREGVLGERVRQDRRDVGACDAAREILEDVSLLTLAEILDERVDEPRGKRLGLDVG